MNKYQEALDFIRSENVTAWGNDNIDKLYNYCDYLEELVDTAVALPIDEWHEDDGDCLWWRFPIMEPPYSGSPLCTDFPDYVTHFTRIIIPERSDEE